MTKFAANSEYEAWAHSFDQLWDDPTALEGMACPTCAMQRLNLIYLVDDREATEGMFALWCDACLTGLPPGMGSIPPGARCGRRGDEVIPDYRLIRQR